MNFSHSNTDKDLIKSNLSTQSNSPKKDDKNTVTTWRKWLLKNLVIALSILTVVATYSYSFSDKQFIAKSTQFAQPINCSNQANRTGYAIQCAATAN
jgi:hypothetical protein